MNAEAQVANGDPLMIAWETYKATAEYANSFSWATRYIPEDDPAHIEKVRASGANPWTREMKVKAVEGSLWAAFVEGYQTTHSRSHPHDNG